MHTHVHTQGSSHRACIPYMQVLTPEHTLPQPSIGRTWRGREGLPGSGVPSTCLESYSPACTSRCWLVGPSQGPPLSWAGSTLLPLLPWGGWDQHPRSEPSHEAGTGHSLGKGWRQARPIFPGADSHRAKRAGVQDSQSPPELTPLSPKAEAHPQRWTVCQGAGKWQVKLSVLLKLPQDKEEASP